MPQSDSITKLATALSKAQAVMAHAAKDSTNPHFRSKYADLPSVVDAIRGPLTDNGLAWMQHNEPCEDGVLVVTTILHSSGEWIADKGLHVPASKRDAQGFGSAMTYARRYALMAMTGLAPDDDDGNAATAAAPKYVSAFQQKQLVAAAIAGGAEKKKATTWAMRVTVDQFDDKLAEVQAKAAAKTTTGGESK